jgi:phosphohistidine phosphatase
MLTLLVLRHAKPENTSVSGRDHDRPLSEQGKKDAALIGRHLAAIDLQPDSVLTSSALRARSTVTAASEAGAWSCPIRATDALYDTVPGLALEQVQAEPDATKVLLISGHEPTWSALVSLLIGGGIVRFSAGTLACIEFHVERWSDVQPGRGQLAWLLPPDRADL